METDEDLPRPLAVHELRRDSAPPAEDSRFLSPRRRPPGQGRAERALRLALGTPEQDFHVFLSGAPGAGRRAFSLSVLEESAAGLPAPDDACYLPGLEDPQRPRALILPAGKGKVFQDAVDGFLRQVVARLPEALVEPGVLARRRLLEKSWSAKREALLEPLREAARAQGFLLQEDERHFYFVPVREGRAVSPEEFSAWPEEEQARAREAMARLALELEEVQDHFPALERGRLQALRQLQRETLTEVLQDWSRTAARAWSEHPPAAGYFHALAPALAEAASSWLDASGPWTGLDDGPLEQWRQRFGVHLFVSHDGQGGAPVVYEDHPTLRRLFGEVRYRSEGSALVTDHHLIRAGSLARANGGFLLLEAHRLLGQEKVWTALKRALASGALELEPRALEAGEPGAPPFAPEPIPLRVKVILVGEAEVWEALSAMDPDFPGLFRVLADMDDTLPRDPAGEAAYAAWVRHLLDEAGLPPFSGEALARVVETAARWSGDARRLLVHRGRLRGLLLEAGQMAEGAALVSGAHVEAALAARAHRHGRLREVLLEETLRDTLWVETGGRRIGQVNGLTVIDAYDEPFGRPVRITARVWPGEGQLTDIEREVSLSGPIHDKGSLIVHGFLAQRYSLRHSLPLAASVVFEQSYGEIEGDSASSAELYALLSALAGVPVRQDLAVTGAVDQHGRVLAVGDVNEKIEGFFELCRARGPLQGQGVIIPEANVEHLMLSREVVAAVARGGFHIYAAAHVDQGIALLTGIPAGRPDAAGGYPEGSLNARILATLDAFAERVERRHEDDGASH